MFTPYKKGYGYGFSIGKWENPNTKDSLTFIEHGGANGGFNALIFRCVNDKNLIVLLTNTNEAKLGYIKNRIRSILYNRPYDRPEPEIKKIVAEAAKAKYRELKKTKLKEYGEREFVYEFSQLGIRALQNNFAAAVNAGDVDAIMKNYVPDKSLVVFDVVPRKEYLGADAYRRGWEDFYTHYKGIPKLSILDPGITVDGTVAFGHSFMNVKGADAQGHPVDRILRVSAGYRKIEGNWLIAHEHISVPVDLATGMAVPVARP